MKVGTGYDAHRLIAGTTLVLGGVTIPHQYGLAGHSDGDVVVHAIIDAILGAASLGDIGTYFPSDDSQYKGVKSIILLAKTRDLLRNSGWQVQNLDATIVAERPRLTPYVTRMRQTVGQSLNLEPELISIKASTTDGLGFIGREEGIAAYAIVSIDAIS